VKAILRHVTFAALSLYFTQLFIEGFDFGENEIGTFALLIIALTILNIFIIPILGVISLPVKGFGFMFFNFLLTAVILFVLTVFIPWFGFISTTLPELIILGIVLPSKHLSAAEAGIASALSVSLIYNFLIWIGKYR
jgi:uncharacterized membrane protein YvlD (DUF360 family)